MAGAGSHAAGGPGWCGPGRPGEAVDLRRAGHGVGPGARRALWARAGAHLVGPAPDLVGLGGTAPDEHRARGRRAPAAALPRSPPAGRLGPVRDVPDQTTGAPG